MPAIVLEHVWKSYPRHTGRLLLRNKIAGWFRRPPQPFYALRDVSFTLEHGEGVAVIGPNGAGKSTLLSLLSGLVAPDRGHATVNGRVGALLELGSGFHPDLTGAENIHLNAALLGFSGRNTEAMFEDIVEFSGLRDSIHEPLRTYSTGMTMRLAFAVAVQVNPDILILDEILQVGDHAFQAKCLEKVQEFKRAGKTILCVSHAAASLLGMCGRAIWLDRGELILDGEIRRVVAAYEGLAVPEENS